MGWWSVSRWSMVLMKPFWYIVIKLHKYLKKFFINMDFFIFFNLSLVWMVFNDKLISKPFLG